MGRAACLLPWAERLSSKLCKNQEVTFFKNQKFSKIPNLDITVIVEGIGLHILAYSLVQAFYCPSISAIQPLFTAALSPATNACLLPWPGPKDWAAANFARTKWQIFNNPKFWQNLHNHIFQLLAPFLIAFLSFALIKQLKVFVIQIL